MGNCVRKQSTTEWGGEDWGSFGSGDVRGGSAAEEKESKGGVLAAETEVKIKISKKELERLMKEADIEGLSMRQVLTELMNAADQFQAHQRSWRPNLNSIPE